LITRDGSKEVEHKRKNIIIGGYQIKKCTARGGSQTGEHCG